MTSPIYTSDEEFVEIVRYFNKHVVKAASGCWDWTGLFDSSGNPVCVVSFGGVDAKVSATQVSWKLHRVVAPPRQIFLTCKNKHCTNPWHINWKVRK